MAAVTLATHRLTENSRRMWDKGSRDAAQDEEEPDGRSLLRQGQEEGRSPERPEDHHEEREAGTPGDVPRVRREGLPDRRLTPTFDRRKARGPRRTAGASSIHGE